MDKFPVPPPKSILASPGKHDLRKKALEAAKLAAPPPITSTGLGVVGEDDEGTAGITEQRDQVPACPPSTSGRQMPKPTSWEKYWDKQIDIELPER